MIRNIFIIIIILVATIPLYLVAEVSQSEPFSLSLKVAQGTVVERVGESSFEIYDDKGFDCSKYENSEEYKNICDEFIAALDAMSEKKQEALSQEKITRLREANKKMHDFIKDHSKPRTKGRVEFSEKDFIEYVKNDGAVMVSSEIDYLALSLKDREMGIQAGYDSRDSSCTTCKFLPCKGKSSIKEYEDLFREKIFNQCVETLNSFKGAQRKYETNPNNRLKWTSKNCIQYLEQPNKSGGNDFFSASSLSFIPLPDHPVHVGDTWNMKLLIVDEQTLALRSENAKYATPRDLQIVSKLLNHLECRVTVIERHQGIITLGLDLPFEKFQMTPSMLFEAIPKMDDDTKGDPKFFSEEIRREFLEKGGISVIVDSFKGTVKIDERTGLLKEAVVDADVTFVIKQSSDDAFGRHIYSSTPQSIRVVGHHKVTSNR